MQFNPNCNKKWKGHSWMVEAGVSLKQPFLSIPSYFDWQWRISCSSVAEWSKKNEGLNRKEEVVLHIFAGCEGQVAYLRTACKIGYKPTMVTSYVLFVEVSGMCDHVLFVCSFTWFGIRFLHLCMVDKGICRWNDLMH